MNLRVENINFNWNKVIMPNAKRDSYSNLAPLKCDMVSFGAMKKTQFEGFDLFIINKFKAPIEKFNSNKDLQDWCREQIDKLSKTDLGGRQVETTAQREATFKEWYEYVLKENDAYTNTMSLLILDGILKDIKPDNDMEIPPLNKGVLAQTVSEIQDKLKENPKIDINFNKEYRMNLQKISLDDLETHLDSNETGWVVIPSKINDPEHFRENVDRLKTLSHKNWCTASFNAEPYLAEGDFHVYLENGRPKLGVRFVGDEIEEIQGEKNNGKIPIKYLDIASEHTTNDVLSNSAEEEFEQAYIAKENLAKLEEKLKEQGVDFKTCSARQLFDVMGIKYEVDPKDGLLILDQYIFDFDEMGVSENRLFKEIKEIRGDANFYDSQVTNLGNLQSIGGSAYFRNSKITDLRNLQSIGGGADFKNSQIKSLGKLKNIGGFANLSESSISDLGDLESIGGWADFKDSQITNLGNLQSIGKDADFRYSQIKSLGKLKNIGGFANLSESSISDLGDLESIGGWANFKNSQITNLGNLQSIGKNVDFRYSKVTNLGNLRVIGGDAYFSYSDITHLRYLQCIKGDVYIKNSKLEKSDFKKIKISGKVKN